MKLLGIVLVGLIANPQPGRAETWACLYKGDWTTKNKDTGAMNFSLVWNGSGSSWKVTGEYDDKDGHGVVTGECDKSQCRFQHAYKSGKLAGKTIYFLGDFRDREISKTETENSFTGKWGTSAANRIGAGSFKAMGRCVEDGPLPTVPDSTKQSTPAFEALRGVSNADVVKWFGEPKSRSKLEEQAMTGGWASTWLYPAKGLRLTMESSDKKGPFTVKFVTIEGTNPTKTKLGIGIGATRAAVEKAYGTRVQAEASDAGQVYTADSNDGSATTFTIKGGKVTSITHGDNMIGGGD